MCFICFWVLLRIILFYNVFTYCFYVLLRIMLVFPVGTTRGDYPVGPTPWGLGGLPYTMYVYIHFIYAIYTPYMYILYALYINITHDIHVLVFSYMCSDLCKYIWVWTFSNFYLFTNTFKHIHIHTNTYKYIQIHTKSYNIYINTP